MATVGSQLKTIVNIVTRCGADAPLDTPSGQKTVVTSAKATTAPCHRRRLHGLAAAARKIQDIKSTHFHLAVLGGTTAKRALPKTASAALEIAACLAGT